MLTAQAAINDPESLPTLKLQETVCFIMHLAYFNRENDSDDSIQKYKLDIRVELSPFLPKGVPANPLN